MHIARVRIENYRSIRCAEVAPERLCALIGGNNSGKSNVLSAIAKVLGPTWPSIRAFDVRDFYAHDLGAPIRITIWFSDPIEVRGDVGDPVPAHGVSFMLTQYKKASGKHRKGDLKSSFWCVDEAGDAVKVSKRHSKSNKVYQTEANVTSAVRDSLPVVFIETERNVRKQLAANKWSILGRLLQDVANALREDDKRFNEFRTAFDQARALLRTEEFEKLEEKVLANVARHTGLDGVEVIFDDIDPLNLYQNFAVLFRDPETPQPVDVDRMGSGIQSAVVISLLQTYRELKRSDAVLLFEEPELFLHPHGRRHLFSLLQDLSNAGTQVIYTTHSEEFVDLERLDGVRLVSKTREEGTIIKKPTTAPLSPTWRKRLKLIRHFSSPRNEVFFADSVVLVEGRTDEAAIRYLMGLCPDGVDLNRLNCSVIEVGGKPALPVLMPMIRALDKRLMVVHDTDSDEPREKPRRNHEDLNSQIAQAAQKDAWLHPCDPHLEGLAGMDVASRNKEAEMREFLEAVESWDSLPEKFRALIERVAAFAAKRPDPMEDVAYRNTDQAP
ncbi:MAG: ATP-dependent endonuclease [Vicinamibacterales bacterium]